MQRGAGAKNKQKMKEQFFAAHPELNEAWMVMGFVFATKEDIEDSGLMAGVHNVEPEKVYPQPLKGSDAAADKAATDKAAADKAAADKAAADKAATDKAATDKAAADKAAKTTKAK